MVVVPLRAAAPALLPAAVDLEPSCADAEASLAVEAGARGRAAVEFDVGFEVAAGLRARPRLAVPLVLLIEPVSN